MPAQETAQDVNLVLGIPYLLNEFRDLRKSIDARDDLFRESMAEIKEDLIKIGGDFSRHQTYFDMLKVDLDKLASRHDGTETRVSNLCEIQQKMLEEAAKHEEVKANSWSGPKALAKTISIIAGGLAGLGFLITVAAKYLTFSQ